MKEQPSTNGANGRRKNGQFDAGNKLGKGNPFARHVARLRSAMLRSVSRDDLQTIVKAIVEKAKSGDVAAAKEVLDRCIGRPTPATELE